MKFSYLDLFFILLFAAGGYVGFRAGPLKKSLTLLAVVVSLVLGFRLMSPLGGVLARTGLLQPQLSIVIAFLLVSSLMLTGAFLLLRRFGKKSGAGTPGRIGAALIGIVEGAVALSFLLLMLKLLDVPSASARTHSLLYRPLVNLAPRLFDQVRNFFPDESEVHEGFEEPEMNGP